MTRVKRSACGTWQGLDCPFPLPKGKTTLKIYLNLILSHLFKGDKILENELITKGQYYTFTVNYK